MKKIIVLLLMNLPLLAAQTEQNNQKYSDTLYAKLQEECVNDDTCTTHYCSALEVLHEKAQTKSTEFAADIEKLKQAQDKIEIQKKMFDRCWHRDLLEKDTHDKCKQEIIILCLLAQVPFNESL